MPSRSLSRIGACRPRHEPTSVLALDQIRLLALLDVVSECPGQRGEDTARSHDPVEMAIFVVDERQRNFGRAQHRQRIHRVHQVGNHRRRSRQLAQVELAPVEQRLEQVAGLDHADDIVDRAFRDRESGCAAFPSAPHEFSPVAEMSIQSTSVRGVITSRTGRSARRTIPEMIARSLSSRTPAVCASATTR